MSEIDELQQRWNRASLRYRAEMMVDRRRRMFNGGPRYIFEEEDGWYFGCGDLTDDGGVDGPWERAMDEDLKLREPGCVCQWEEGDSPCPVHDYAAEFLDTDAKREEDESDDE